MSQEIERPELGLSVFEPQAVSPEVRLYQETLDLDQKALILNRDIVRIEESVATTGTVRVLAIIASEQHRGVSQYRSDAVVALNPESLVAVTNGLASDEEEVIDPLSGAIRRIQQTQGRALLKEVGITTQSKSRDEDLEILEEEVMAELAERLNDVDLNFSERRQLIASIDAMITPQALRRISKKGEILTAFLRASNEFTNEELRAVLERIPDLYTNPSFKSPL